jgi:hypothetical protein
VRRLKPETIFITLNPHVSTTPAMLVGQSETDLLLKFKKGFASKANSAGFGQGVTNPG